MNLTFLFVAVVYFAAVALLRLRFPILTWRVAFLFYALILAFLFQPLALDYVSFPADYITRLIPWHADYDPHPGSNTETNDLPFQIVPWIHLAREAWKSLEFPLWNASAGSGYPLLASSQSAALSPYRFLTLPLSLGHAVAAESALKLLFALTFAFLYIRRRGLSTEASLIGAISFGLSSFLAIWLGFPHATVAAILPGVLLGIDLLIEAVTYRAFLFLTVMFTFLLLNGQPEIASHVVFTAVIYVAFWLAIDPSREKLRPLAVMAVAGVVAIIISLPAILPLIEALPRSLRYDVIQIRGHQEIARHWNLFVLLFNPRFYGMIKEGNLWGPSIAEFATCYAGLLGLAGWIAFAPRLIRRESWRDPMAFYPAALPFFAAIALGVPGFADAFERLPVFSLAANGRIRLAVCWCVAVLAAMFVDAFIRKGEWRRVIGSCLGVAGLVALFFAIHRFPSREHLSYVGLTALPGLGALLAAILVVILKPVRQRVGMALLVAAVGLDLWSAGYPWNPPVPSRYLYPMTPLIRDLQARVRSSKEPVRIAGSHSALFPNTSAIYGFEDIRVHDPMANARYMGLLRVILRYTTTQYFAHLKILDHSLLDYLNVRYVITHKVDHSIGERFVKIYEGRDGTVFENKRVLPRFFAVRNVVNEFDDVRRTDMMGMNSDWKDLAYVKRLPSTLYETVKPVVLAKHSPHEPMANVKITAASARRYDVAVDAPRWTLIVSSVPHWPGWRAYNKATGDEIKVIVVNEVFIGFLAPPGKMDVKIVYRPLSFYVGMWVSLAIIVILSALGIHSVRRGTTGVIRRWAKR